LIEEEIILRAVHSAKKTRHALSGNGQFRMVRRAIRYWNAMP